MSARTAPLPPDHVAFADALGCDVVTRAEAAGISAGLLVLLLGRIAGLTVSAAAIDGSGRDEVLRAMHAEAEAMARLSDEVRERAVTFVMEEGRA